MTETSLLRLGLMDILSQVDEAVATLEGPWVLPKQRRRRADAQLAIFGEKLARLLDGYCAERGLDHLFRPDLFGPVVDSRLNDWHKSVLPVLQGLGLRDPPPLTFFPLSCDASPYVAGCLFQPHNVDIVGGLAIGRADPPSESVVLDLQLALQVWVIIRRIFLRLSAQAAPAPSLRHDAAGLGRQEALNDLVVSLAHHMNTPIGVAVSAASLIDTKVASLATDPAAASSVVADLQELCEILERNARHAHRLIESFKLLSVSQLAGRCEDFDLLTLTQESVEAVRASFSSDEEAASSLELPEIEIEDERQPTCGRWRGYAGHFQRVLQNLLENVVHHAYPTGVHARVRIIVWSSLQEDRARFRISVVDSGAGIPPGNLAKVFTPFFTTGDYARHAGLGLTTVKTIAEEAFGGTVKCTSALGQGTTVTLEFSHCSDSEATAPSAGILSVTGFDAQRFVELQRGLGSGDELSIDGQLELELLKVAYDELLRATFAPDGRRASIRVPVRRPVTVMLRDRAMVGELRDVSEQGAMLVMAEEIHIDANVIVRCGEGPDLHVAGKVLSVLSMLEPDSRRPTCRLGVRFDNPTNAQRRALRILIAEHLLSPSRR